jgi:hypothetical protein
MTVPKRLRTIKDRRSTWARRHKALADAFAVDLGDKLSAADRSFADHAATVGVECERMKARQLNDDPVDVPQRNVPILSAGHGDAFRPSQH